MLRKDALKFYVIITCTLWVQVIFCQEYVKGRVIDKVTNEPIPFVSIQTDLNSGTYSNDFGEFNLNEPISDSVIFSLIGYENTTVFLKDLVENPIVKMVSVAYDLDEVRLVENVSQDFSKKNWSKDLWHTRRNFTYGLAKSKSTFGTKIAIPIIANNRKSVVLSRVVLPIVKSSVRSLVRLSINKNLGKNSIAIHSSLISIPKGSKRIRWDIEPFILGKSIEYFIILEWIDSERDKNDQYAPYIFCSEKEFEVYKSYRNNDWARWSWYTPLIKYQYLTRN